MTPNFQPKIKKRSASIFLTLSLIMLSACSNQNSSDNFNFDSGNQGNSGNTTSSTSGILDRLNGQNKSVWVEDPANDLTGSKSLAVYLENSANGCAVWVFENESDARSALDNGILNFAKSQVYVGKDTYSDYGIIAVSPFSGADCEFVIADVFGWGK